MQAKRESGSGIVKPNPMEGKTAAQKVLQANSGDGCRADGQKMDGRGASSKSFAVIVIEWWGRKIE